MRIVFLLLALSSLLFGGVFIKGKVENEVEADSVWRCDIRELDDFANGRETITLWRGNNNSIMTDIMTECIITAQERGDNFAGSCVYPEAKFIYSNERNSDDESRGSKTSQILSKVMDEYNKKLYDLHQELAGYFMDIIEKHCKKGKYVFKEGVGGKEEKVSEERPKEYLEQWDFYRNTKKPAKPSGK